MSTPRRSAEAASTRARGPAQHPGRHGAHERTDQERHTEGGTASIAASACASLPAAVAAARQNRNVGATMPSLRPLSAFRTCRSRSGMRWSRTKETAGARSTASRSSRARRSATGRGRERGRRRPATPDEGQRRAIRSSRRVRRGSRPRTPPGTSVASVNSRIATMTSTMRSAASNSDVEDEHRVLPGGEGDAGDEQRERRGHAVPGQSSGDQGPAEQQQQMTTSASIGPPADQPAGVLHPVRRQAGTSAKARCRVGSRPGLHGPGIGEDAAAGNRHAGGDTDSGFTPWRVLRRCRADRRATVPVRWPPDR